MGDPIFKNKAREHQVEFFKKDGIDAVRPEYGRAKNVRGMLNKDDASNGLIFYEGYRRQILSELERNDVKSGMMKCHALRSEHIPWNLFFPMTLDSNLR